MIKDKIFKHILKSKKYVYRPANTKLLRKEKLVEFVKMYFGNHVPSQEEWHDFFVDLMKEYAVSSYVPDIEICNLPLNKTDEEIENSEEIVYGQFNKYENKIRISKQRIKELELETYSFIRLIDTLMHEMRHFYQFKARMEISGHVYQDMFESKSDFHGRKLGEIDDVSEMELLFKIIHRATSNCSFVEEVIVKDETEKKRILEDLIFGFYSNDPIEKDAERAGMQMTKKIYEELYEGLDKKSKVKFKKDYINMLEMLIKEEHAADKSNYYFSRLKSDIKKLEIKELDKIGEVVDRSKSSPEFGLYIKFMESMFLEDALKDKLSLCINAIYNNCSNVLKCIFSDADFDYNDCRQLEEIILSQFVKNNLDANILVFAVNNRKLIRENTLKEMIIDKLLNEDYWLAIFVYDMWMKRSCKIDERAFANKMIGILMGNLEEIRTQGKGNYLNKFYKMKDIEKFLERLIKDSLIKEADVQDVLSSIEKFTCTENGTR